MIQNYQRLRKYISSLLIVINSQIDILDANIKWKDLVNKSDISEFITNSNLDKKIAN